MPRHQRGEFKGGSANHACARGPGLLRVLPRAVLLCPSSLAHTYTSLRSSRLLPACLPGTCMWSVQRTLHHVWKRQKQRQRRRHDTYSPLRPSRLAMTGISHHRTLKLWSDVQQVIQPCQLILSSAGAGCIVAAAIKRCCCVSSDTHVLH